MHVTDESGIQCRSIHPPPTIVPEVPLYYHGHDNIYSGTIILTCFISIEGDINTLFIKYEIVFDQFFSAFSIDYHCFYPHNFFSKITFKKIKLRQSPFASLSGVH